LDKFGIPAAVGTDINLFVNFSFTPHTYPIVTGSAVSFLLNFRDDYNPATKSFANSYIHYLSNKMMIYLWASSHYQTMPQEIGSFNYFGV
jgi:hypothetical protein